MLQAIDGVTVIPTTLDLSSAYHYELDRLPISLGKLLLVVAKGHDDAKQREDRELLSKRFANLSVTQALRLFLLASCVKNVLDFTIPLMSSGRYEPCWKKVSLFIDRTAIAQKSREELVFDDLLGRWLHVWSVVTPTPLLDWIHKPGHLLIDEYDTPDGLDFGKMLKGHIHWESSRQCWGIQMADITASIVYSAVRDLDERNGALTLFGELMKTSLYGFAVGPSVIQPGGPLPQWVKSKYLPLHRAMRAAKT
jgi:hypothetical protein